MKEVITYLEGYGVWKIIIDDGDITPRDGNYSLFIKKGKVDGKDVENLDMRVPINSTVIKEQR